MNIPKINNKLTQSKGFTLLEMFLVVVIMAAIGFVAARHYSGVSASNKAHEVLMEVNQIHAAAQLYYQDKKTGATQVSDLINDGYLANNYQLTPWGAEYSLTAPENGKYSITVPNIPSVGLCNIIFNRIQSTINTQAGQSVSNGTASGTSGEIGTATVCTFVTVTYPL